MELLSLIIRLTGGRVFADNYHNDQSLAITQEYQNMKSNCTPLCKILTIVLAGWLTCCSGGCQPKKAAEETAVGPVLFPAPPDQPRLQFLTSYWGAESFGKAKSSFLETFVLGAPEEMPDQILKPYGLAIHEGKIYVCDIGQSQIKVLDLKKKKFEKIPSGRGFKNPVNIFIEADGTKYVADSLGGVIFVYNNQDKLISFLGRDLQIKPLDVAVRGNQVYITDAYSDQVVVLDKTNGQLLKRIGGKQEADESDPEADKYTPMITGLDLDQEGNIYVSDRLNNRVSKFSDSGEPVRMYGKYGSSPASLMRAKGVALDREDRVWVVDAGPATAVKVFRGNDGRLLMLFGRLGNEPGQMYMPAAVCIDYDNVDLFKKYAVDGAELEFVVLVTNQFGPHKVSVYGFGKFPTMFQPQQPVKSQTDTNTEP